MAKGEANSHLHFCKKKIIVLFKTIIIKTCYSRLVGITSVNVCRQSRNVCVISKHPWRCGPQAERRLSASVISSQTVERYEETHYANEAFPHFFCCVLCYFRVANSEHHTSLAIYHLKQQARAEQFGNTHPFLEIIMNPTN